MVELTEETRVELGSDRSFGFVFAIVFAIIACWPLMSGGDPRWWSVIIAALFVGVALIAPGVLRPLNKIWFQFGMLLSRIVNPIVMFIIYVISVLPIGLIMQLLGKDLLRLKFESEQRSYWIERTPPGPEPETIEEVF